jgi:hypothetical protein
MRASSSITNTDAIRGANLRRRRHDDVVRRSLGMLVVWFLGTFLAAFVAWQGIAVVADAVTGDRPGDLTGDDVAAALAAASAASTAPGGSASTTTSAPAGSVTTASTATTAPAGTATTAPTTSSPPATAEASTRNYSLVGGTVTVRFSPTAVTVISAVPRNGYSVELEQEGPTQVSVRFESDDHESRLDAYWSDGPRDEVEERDESDSGGDDSD